MTKTTATTATTATTTTAATTTITDEDGDDDHEYDCGHDEHNDKCDDAPAKGNHRIDAGDGNEFAGGRRCGGWRRDQ